MAAPRNDEKALAMFALYERGFSLAQVAKAFGCTRQGVFKMFLRRGFKMRTVQPVPFVMWRGEKFSLRPSGYYSRTRGDRRGLHCLVWESENGAVPRGMDVHHVDHDKTNNCIKNLCLVTPQEHGRIHYPSRIAFQAKQFKPGCKGVFHKRKNVA